MSVPVFVLAGQSNAGVLHDSVVAALDARFGSGGYALATSFAGGAPLVFKRPGLDWHASSEMPTQLADATAQVLENTEGGFLAGMIWVQGEADTYPIADAQTYSDDFLNLVVTVSDLLTDRVGADHGFDDMAIVLSELANTAPAAAARAHWDTIISQQDILADLDAITSVDPDALMAALGLTPDAAFRDHLHYSAGFEDDLARALVDALPPPADTAPQSPAADHWIGSPQADTYVVDHFEDTIFEPRGTGTDVVLSSVDFSLRDHSQRLENLTLVGDDDLRGVGNGRHNLLEGNAGDNRLFGMWGNDTLIGGDGRNLLDGGQGDDTFVVSSPLDRLVERADQGHDQVHAHVDVSLRNHSQHLEDLYLMGTDDLRATGNGRANLMMGNAGDNRIDGAWGRDTIDGGAGNDTLVGGHHGDVFRFSGDSGHDVIRDFTLGEDRIDLADTAIPDPAAAADFLLGHARVDADTDLLLDLGDGRSIRLLDVVDDGPPAPMDAYADMFFS